MIKPGLLLSDLNNKTIELLTDALMELKIIDNRDDYRKYYMHGVSHFLGMDTHDVGFRERKLEPGMVITVEPGLYIPEENTGVRIEDDILVTKDGFKNLSAQIIKEIKDLENV